MPLDFDRPHTWERALVVFLASALVGAGLAFAGLSNAFAQEARSATQFNVPFGAAPGDENRPIGGSTRDANGNRLIVNGRFESGSSLERREFESRQSSGFGTLTGATAIGNNLSVVTNGSFNTIIVDATQINEGDQEAHSVLNGSLDLD